MRRASRITLLVLLASASAAHANGRFPNLETAHYQSGGDDLLIGGTFGILYSKDGRSDFRWACEAAIGYGGYFDPDLAESPAGVIFAGTFDGLARSEDGGCTWGYAGGDARGLWIDGLVAHPTDSNQVFLATASGGKTNAIMRSTDAGKTFTIVPSTSSNVQFFKSLMMAPSTPQRLYATSYTVVPETTTLWKSTDGGQSFATIDFPHKGGNTFELLAIHPSNPDILFVKTDGPVPVGGGEPDVIVYRSTNGGVDFTEVFRSLELVGGLALSADGQTVALSTRPSGLKRSTNGGMTFTQVPGPPGDGGPRAPKQIRCVISHGGVLQGCGNNFSDGFAFGETPSFGATDVSWTKIMSFTDIKGPIDCPANAVATWLPNPTSVDPLDASRATRELCTPLWPTTQVQLGIAGVDGGMIIPIDGSVTPPKDPDTCGCRTGRRGTLNPAGATLALLALLALIWRTRCREPS